MIIHIRHHSHSVKIKAPASRRLKKKLEKLPTYAQAEFFIKRIDKLNIEFYSRTTVIPAAVVSNYVFRKKYASHNVFEEILSNEDAKFVIDMQDAAARHALLPLMTAH